MDEGTKFKFLGLKSYTGVQLWWPKVEDLKFLTSFSTLFCVEILCI